MSETKEMLLKSCKMISDELGRRKDDMFFYSEEEHEDLGDENYFDDILDIKYILDSDRCLMGVRICVAWGGPNIYIDTLHNSIEGYWGRDNVSIPLEYGVAEAIDSYFEEYL